MKTTLEYLTALLTTLLAKGGITPKGLEHSRHVIVAPPSREPSNVTRRNMVVDFISAKMGFAIPLESVSVEAAYAVLLEFQKACIAFFSQPLPISVQRTDKAGKRIRVWTTFDLLAVYEDRIEMVECKPEEQLNKLSQQYPDLYSRDPEGNWRSQAYEDALAPFGYKCRIVSSADLPTPLVKNYWVLGQLKNERYSNKDALNNIRERIPTGVGATLEELLAGLNGAYTKNDVYLALLRNELFGPLSEERLNSTKTFPVFRRPEDLEVYRFRHRKDNPSATDAVMLSAGAKVRWRGASYLAVNVSGEVVSLQGDEGSVFDLPIDVVRTFLRKGEMTVLGDTRALREQQHKELSSSICRLSAAALDRGSRRARFLDAYRVNPNTDPRHFGLEPVCERTLQRWSARQRESKQRWGSAHWGAYEAPRNTNRKSILPAEVHDAMRRYAIEEYFSPKAPSLRHVHRLLRRDLASQHLPCPSYRSFRRIVKKLKNAHDTQLARKGSRSAYGAGRKPSSAPSWLRSSDFPLMVAQIDAQLMDVMLVDDETEEQLGRPSITLITLPYYGSAPVGMSLTFERESSRSALTALRDMVERHRRGPAILVADNGSAYNNARFDQACSALQITKALRPPHSPRFSAEIESAFKRLNVELIHNLRGNTKYMPRARDLSPTHLPEKYAVWTLKDFVPLLEDYLFNKLWDAPVPKLGTSPRAAFERDAKRAPDTPDGLLVESEILDLLMCPDVSRGGVRRVQPGRGVSLLGYYYWHDEMEKAEFERQMVSVRFDPYDLTYVWVYLGDGWVRAENLNPPDLLNITEKNRRISMLAHRTLRAHHSRRREALHGVAMAELGNQIVVTEKHRIAARQARAERDVRHPASTPKRKINPPKTVQWDFSSKRRDQRTRL